MKRNKRKKEIKFFNKEENEIGVYLECANEIRRYHEGIIHKAQIPKKKCGEQRQMGGKLKKSDQSARGSLSMRTTKAHMLLHAIPLLEASHSQRTVGIHLRAVSSEGASFSGQGISTSLTARIVLKKGYAHPAQADEI